MKYWTNKPRIRFMKKKVRARVTINLWDSFRNIIFLSATPFCGKFMKITRFECEFAFPLGSKTTHDWL